MVREAHADLREQILNLASTGALERSLFTAARQYLDGFTRSHDIRTRLAVEPGLDDATFPPAVRLQLFRILQEALSNARKHGQAHQVQVSFTAGEGRVCMTVDDDGCGFDAQRVARDPGAHFGLQFMADRAEELGGSLQVTSAPGRGTRVAVEMPRSRSSA